MQQGTIPHESSGCATTQSIQDKNEDGTLTSPSINTDPQSNEPVAGPDVGNLDPTDGRKKFDWESRYPSDAKFQIRCQAWYILILLFVALALIFATWMDVFTQLLSLPPSGAATLRKYCYYSFSGLFGGTVFGMKYMYRVVARGYWHEDRNLWRYQSPFIALAVSFAFGTLIDGKFMSVGAHTSGAAIVGLGFLIGYFADDATGKLHEIAGVLFGKASAKSKELPPQNKS